MIWGLFLPFLSGCFCLFPLLCGERDGGTGLVYPRTCKGICFLDNLPSFLFSIFFVYSFFFFFFFFSFFFRYYLALVMCEHIIINSSYPESKLMMRSWHGHDLNYNYITTDTE